MLVGIWATTLIFRSKALSYYYVGLGFFEIEELKALRLGRLQC